MNFVKKIKSFLIIALAAALVVAVIPFTTSASSSSNIQTIFNFLVSEMGLNPAAACGVLGNIEYESDFDNHLYGDSGSSYGICQWHKERLSNMKSFCSKNGYDWKSLEGQLYFLKYELSNNKSDTGYIIDKLKSVSNTASGAYKAGYDWCYYFERPANKSSSSEKRGARARDYYWPKYGVNAGSSAVTTTTAPKTTTTTAPSTTTKPAITENPTKAAASVGDVNNDGKINSADALIIVQYSVGSKSITSSQKKLGDVDGNGKVTSADALIILNVSTGKDNIKNYK